MVLTPDSSNHSGSSAEKLNDTNAECIRPSPDLTTSMGGSDGATVRQPSGELIETAIKFASFAGAVAAVIGFPAVYVNFARLGIPTQFINYNLLLSAGILPAVVFATLALLFRSVLRQVRERGASTPFQAILMLPLMVPVIPVMFVGLAAYVLLLLWCLAWLITRPLRLLGLVDPSNRQLLYVSLVLGIIVLTVWLIDKLMKERISQFWLVRWLAQTTTRTRRQSSAYEFDATAEDQPATEKSDQKKTLEEKANQWLRLLPYLWLGIPAICVGLLFAIKAILYFWDPSLSEKLKSETVVWAGVGLGILYSLPMSSIAWDEFIKCEGRGMKNRGLAIAFASVLISGTFFVILYSTKIYPELNQAWGGGKLASVTVWVDSEDVPPVGEMRQRLLGSTVTLEGEVVRIDSSFALQVGKERIILIGRSPTAVGGISLPVDSIKMVAWGPGG